MSRAQKQQEELQSEINLDLTSLKDWVNGRQCRKKVPTNSTPLAKLHPPWKVQYFIFVNKNNAEAALFWQATSKSKTNSEDM